MVHFENRTGGRSFIGGKIEDPKGSSCDGDTYFYNTLRLFNVKVYLSIYNFNTINTVCVPNFVSKCLACSLKSHLEVNTLI